MPFVKSLSNFGYNFPCVCVAPFTTTSHVSILTGLYPYQHGIRHLYGEKLDPRIRMIQHELRDMDYKTHAHVSCFHMTHIGIENGFDTFTYRPYVKDDPHGRGAYNPAEVLVDRAIKTISDSRTDKNFLFLHFFDAHVHVGEKYEKLYKDELSVIDQQIRRLYDYFAVYRGDTLFVITSDHGKKLYEGEHNFPCLNPRNPEVDPKPCKFDHKGEGGHGAELYEEIVRVPLVVHKKEWTERSIFLNQISSIDIPNLILFELGVSTIESYYLWADYLWEGRPYVYIETFSPDHLFDQGIPLVGVRSNEWKLICYQTENSGNRRTFNAAELYNLKTDPKEKKNLFQTDHKQVQRILSELPDLIRKINVDPFQKTEDEKVEKRLKDLGYI